MLLSIVMMHSKVACRKLERKWCCSGLIVFHQAWKASLGQYKVALEKARSSYFSQIIVNNQNNPKHLFHTINCLLKVDGTNSQTASVKLCNDFRFSAKTACVRKHTICSPGSQTPVVNFECFSGTPLSRFSPVHPESLCVQVSSVKAATCVLDPLPTSLFKSCFGVLCSTVLSIINDSLSTGVVPVTPVLKKQNTDVNNLNNFNPISNLPFLAKILKGFVASQLHNHLTFHHIIINNHHQNLFILFYGWSQIRGRSC